MFYRKFGLSTLVYAFIFTVLLFDNFTSITFPIWVIATLSYVYVCLGKLHMPVKRGFWIYGTGMLLLSISVMSTGNITLQLLGYFGTLLLLGSLLLHHFRDDKNWSISKYLVSFICLLFGPIGYIGTFFSDIHENKQLGKNNKQEITTNLLIGISICIPLLLVVGGLLYASDAVFANILDENLLEILNPGKIIGFFALFLFALFSSYGLLRLLCSSNIKNEVSDHRKCAPTIAITILLPISLVYLFYCMIQIFSLFLGKMSLPEGYTYSQYAREGFFQLLFVCIINVILVLLINALFQENLAQKILLTVICGCTYIMLASSAYRMILYIQAYQLTFLRLFVLLSLTVIALFLAGTLITIYDQDFPLMRYMMAVATTLFLIFSFMHPDNVIASYNLSHQTATECKYSDGLYLRNLSTDAAPAIYNYYQENHEEGNDGEKWYLDYAKSHEQAYSTHPWHFNISRYIAHHTTGKFLQ